MICGKINTPRQITGEILASVPMKTDRCVLLLNKRGMLSIFRSKNNIYKGVHLNSLEEGKTRMQYIEKCLKKIDL